MAAVLPFYQCRRSLRLYSKCTALYPPQTWDHIPLYTKLYPPQTTDTQHYTLQRPGTIHNIIPSTLRTRHHCIQHYTLHRPFTALYLPQTRDYTIIPLCPPQCSTDPGPYTIVYSIIPSIDKGLYTTLDLHRSGTIHRIIPSTNQEPYTATDQEPYTTSGIIPSTDEGPYTT